MCAASVGEVEVAYHVSPGLHGEQDDVVEAEDPCIETVLALSEPARGAQIRCLSACLVLYCIHYYRHCSRLGLEGVVLVVVRHCVESTLSGAAAFLFPQMPGVVGFPDFSGFLRQPLVSVLILDHIRLVACVPSAQPSADLDCEGEDHLRGWDYGGRQD